MARQQLDHKFARGLKSRQAHPRRHWLVLLSAAFVAMEVLLAWPLLGWAVSPVQPTPLVLSAWGEVMNLEDPKQGAVRIARLESNDRLSAPVSSPTALPARTFTPTITPTSSPTVTATATATATATVTATATATATATVTDTPVPQPPTAVPLPDTAVIPGVSGQNQSLPLSCESRSAADWAHFFGYAVNELEFQYALPFTDNPETGFVGNPRDQAGGIPPHSYGVYAGPVAALLRDFGVPARGYHGLGFDDIRREISGGRPVIVWVVGGVWEGKRVDYTPSDGQAVPVVAMEHTVMVVGYSPEVVVIQDGASRYQVAVKRFRKSWKVLGNQAVFVK